MLGFKKWWGVPEKFDNVISINFRKQDHLKLMVTLWPSFPHFKKFAQDVRLGGIRLNSAMINASDLDTELPIITDIGKTVPLYFDIKGRQLRVTDVIEDPSHLELTLNHPIEVETPTVVLFKAGADFAILNKVVDGKHLIFEGGPKYRVKPGESLCIRHRSLKVNGPIFTDAEIEKIKKVKDFGFKRYFLSYTESQQDLDEFREHVGDVEVIAKIESFKGLEFVATRFKKTENTSLMAARGDLYVEVEKPHHILKAMRLIIEKDPGAYAGSRMMLSLVNSPVPELADFSDLAWMWDIGYRNMMLCDELCLKDNMLSNAVNAMQSFRLTYAN